MIHPPPPPPSNGPRIPVPPIHTGLEHYSSDLSSTPMVHRGLLDEMACALLHMGQDRAAGILHARNALRAAGWSWAQLLTAPVAQYLALRRSYGWPDLPSDTLPAGSGPTPPSGRQADGTWHPGWMGTCARIISERVAWCSVPLLAEASLLAATTSVMPPCRFSSPDQVARMDVLMRSVWREPTSTYPVEG